MKNWNLRIGKFSVALIDNVGMRTGRNACPTKVMGTIAQRDLYRVISEANDRGERVVVATVARTRGSTPQQRGAKMLFFENGGVAGTVGGGCIEAEVWAEARDAMRSGKSALHHFSLTAEEASEEGMVCGGTMEIFLDCQLPIAD